MGAPLLLFAPFLLGRQVLYWGTVLFQFYPWRQVARQVLLSGRLPLWNPLVGNGAPLLANYQSAVFYPPNWLTLLLPVDYALGWLAALHLAWAGVGMVLLAETLGFSRLGQAMAGLAFGLSQYLVGRVGFLSVNVTVAWLPWLVWAAESQLRQAGPATLQARLRAALWLALFTGLMLLAGHAQIAWYSLLLTGSWVLWRLLGSGLPARVRTTTTLWLLAAVAVGLLLASAQLLPTAELLRESPRAVTAGYDFVMNYSFSPWRLLTLAAPDLLGNPARGQFFGYGNYWEDAIYIGMLPLILALGAAAVGLSSLFRRRIADEPWRGLPLFLTMVAGVSLLLAFGRNTPVFTFLYWNVPTFNLFQGPTRIMLGFVFALSLLAGYGASRWPAGPPKGRVLYWTRLGAVGTVAMAVVSAAVWLRVPATTLVGLQFQTVAKAFALAGGLLFAAALLSLLRPPIYSWRWEAAAVLVVAGDLLFAGFGLNPGAPPDLYRNAPKSAMDIRPVLGDHRLFYFPDGDYKLRYETFLTFKSFEPAGQAYDLRESLLPNANILAGVASGNNYDPLVSARYDDLMQVISETRSLALLRLMDVGVIASPTTLDLQEIASAADGAVKFYRTPGEPGRVWIVEDARTVPDAGAALAALADPAFNPAAAVILEADDQPPVPRTLGTLSPVSTHIKVTFEKPGWLLLADTYFPGWVAAVDGVPAPILHGDYAFRAVAVPAGAHTVVFDYQPGSLRLGFWLTGLGVTFTILLGLAAFRPPGRP